MDNVAPVHGGLLRCLHLPNGHVLKHPTAMPIDAGKVGGEVPIK